VAKKAASKKKSTKRSVKMGGDTSRLDTGPLQEHIRKRIKELEGKRSKSARVAEDDTLERLKNALETLEDICHPSMTIPI
jgi:hypothetical protein